MIIFSLREIILTIVGKKTQLRDILDFSLNSYIISQRSVFVIFFSVESIEKRQALSEYKLEKVCFLV